METKEEQQESNDALLKSIIERELNAYVLDKAQSFGYSCTVSIFCELGENNVPYPDRAEIRGLLAEEQRQKITKILSEDLGISKPKQTYINEEVT
jgi:hypothetical protein